MRIGETGHRDDALMVDVVFDSQMTMRLSRAMFPLDDWENYPLADDVFIYRLFIYNSE